MAAEVSSLMRVMNGYKDDRTAVNETAGGGTKSTAMITRDLLGVDHHHHHHHGNSMVVSEENDQSQELDLDLEVPSGWEKRLDLKSGKVYLQRCNSAANSPSSSSDQKLNQLSSNQTVQNPRFQDLNFPPNPSRITLNLFDESNLDLKLVSNSPSSSPSSSSPPSNNIYQSVCTLDRVKSALVRAEKDQMRKRSSASATTTSLWKSSMSPSYSSSSSSKKDQEFEKNLEDERLGNMGSCASPVAAGCPGCLSYVLISRNNPKCPRCNSLVPMPTPKKPRIDLNISI